MSESQVLIVQPSLRDIGAFQVRRALPTVHRRFVGPFVFFDEMGPVDFSLNQGMDVRPHPHIGLSTLTYLYSGEILHRDTLGVEQAIRPGEVNWMTAGSGVAHSERSLRTQASRIHGVQIWMALPKDKEEVAPSFHHFDKASVPEISIQGVRTRVIAGRLNEVQSPIPLHSPATYLDVQMVKGSTFELSLPSQELAVYCVQGELEVQQTRLGPSQLAVVGRTPVLHLRALTDCLILILGGEPFSEVRHVWWNFVSTSKERIERAKDDWRHQRFGNIQNETDWIPLPD